MLIQTEVGRAEVIAKQLAGLPGVLSSEYVTGPYDVVVADRCAKPRRIAGRRRSERPAGQRHHPHADLPDRQRSAPLEFGRGFRDPRRPSAGTDDRGDRGGRRRRRRDPGRRGAPAEPRRRTARRDRVGARAQGRQRRMPVARRRPARTTRRFPSRTRGRPGTAGRGGLARDPGRRGRHSALRTGAARRVRRRQPSSGRRRGAAGSGWAKRGRAKTQAPTTVAAPGSRWTVRCTSH